MFIMESRSIVASWKLVVPEGVFLIEFEHGTTSGKRVIWINGTEYLRKDWMFRLVGPEHFRIGRFDCKLIVEPDGAFGLFYSLVINGQDFVEFQEISKKKWMTWTVDVEGIKQTVLFEKDSMDVWINGNKIDCEVQFIDGGNLTKFSVTADTSVVIKSLSSGNKKQGMIHQFILGNEILQPDIIDRK